MTQGSLIFIGIALGPIASIIAAFIMNVLYGVLISRGVLSNRLLAFKIFAAVKKIDTILIEEKRKIAIDRLAYYGYYAVLGLAIPLFIYLFIPLNVATLSPSATILYLLLLILAQTILALALSFLLQKIFLKEEMLLSQGKKAIISDIVVKIVYGLSAIMLYLYTSRMVVLLLS